MTNKEAVELLKGIKIQLPLSENIKANDAVILAIKALEEIDFWKREAITAQATLGDVKIYTASLQKEMVDE